MISLRSTMMILGSIAFQSVAFAEEPVSFRREVMAVLSRSGCNAGACHGNLNGKGGFKLTLRGEDPAIDIDTITREVFGRRVDVCNPAESLLLRKASGGSHHEGSVRFSTDSREYDILSRWIRAGCPDDSPTLPALKSLRVTPTQKILSDSENEVKIAVEARFADGSVRDVSGLATYDTSNVGIASIGTDGKATRLQFGEVLVLVRYMHVQSPVSLAFLPPQPDFVWKNQPTDNEIDRLLYAQWKSLQLTPSALSDDSIFFRRLFLDTLGILPSADEVSAFLADRSPDKRNRAIALVLERPEFSDYWAQKWADLLHNEEKSLDRKGVRVFHQWIRNAIDSRMPLNEFARQIVAGRGSSYSSPPANFYRAIREPYERSEAVAQIFLGVRLSCAKCHNHPFDRWTQTDYHEFASFFVQLDYRILENKRRDALDKHEFVGEQIVLIDRDKQMLHPRTGRPSVPRFLDSAVGVPPDGPDRLTRLADWVARPDNPFFARAQVNRIWYHLMGRGLVEPNDDFRVSNPPMNAPLLDWLTREFVDREFDLRHLVGTILRSRAWQLSSRPGRPKGEDETHFSHAIVQTLEAEQLLDGFSSVLDVPLKFGGYPEGMRSGRLPAPQQQARRSGKGPSPESFLRVFGKPERLMNCDCERTEDTGLMQAFQLINGDTLQSMLTAPDNRIGTMIRSGRTNSQMIETLWMSALSRHPTPTEAAKLDAFVSRSPDRRKAMEDVVWGLLNSKEFLLRR